MNPTERALEYAKRIIESYQMDIRDSARRLNIDLVALGFCQGLIYREAIPTIERIARGELVV